MAMALVVILAFLTMAVWLTCGVLSWGLEFAYWQRQFPSIAARDYRKDLAASAYHGLKGGPFELWSVLSFCGTRHGLKWW